MVKIEAVVEDELVDQVVTAIREASASRPERRSRVWIYEVLAEISGEDDSE
jgi:nitrogen regulatory protein PII